MHASEAGSDPIIVAYLSRSSVPFLSERDVANTLVVRVYFEVAAIGDVVEVFDILTMAEARTLKGTTLSHLST